MTDLEISKALALAIGWMPRRVGNVQNEVYVNTSTDFHWHNNWRLFDYRDWNVIGPIAEKFDMFPYKRFEGHWDVLNALEKLDEVTPQKAIALAVIGAKK